MFQQRSMRQGLFQGAGLLMGYLVMVLPGWADWNVGGVSIGPPQVNVPQVNLPKLPPVSLPQSIKAPSFSSLEKAADQLGHKATTFVDKKYQLSKNYHEKILDPLKNIHFHPTGFKFKGIHGPNVKLPHLPSPGLKLPHHSHPSSSTTQPSGSTTQAPSAGTVAVQTGSQGSSPVLQAPPSGSSPSPSPMNTGPPTGTSAGQVAISTSGNALLLGDILRHWPGTSHMKQSRPWLEKRRRH